jgi:excisionase family DNA binding protein
VKEIATQLQVNDKTIYAWASQGKIPCVKVNGVIRFDEREIEQWLQKCHVPIGPPRVAAKNRPKASSRARKGLDNLIESAKRAVYTAPGETRPIASPHGKEGADGAR